MLNCMTLSRDHALALLSAWPLQCRNVMVSLALLLVMVYYCVLVCSLLTMWRWGPSTYSLSCVAASLYCMHVHVVLNSCHAFLPDECPDAQGNLGCCSGPLSFQCFDFRWIIAGTGTKADLAWTLKTLDSGKAPCSSLSVLALKFPRYAHVTSCISLWEDIGILVRH